MKKYLLFMFLFVGFISTAQVGIGTTDPKAMIDIPASNAITPVNTDGILIPRVSNLTAAATMTADQNGMMVFLTVDVSGKPKGFYYWDQTTTSWIGVGNLKGNADFYKVGTTAAPDDITDDMFHSGNVAIGKNTATAKLDLEENNTAKTSVLNVQHTATGSVGTYANIRTQITGSGYSGIMVGAENTVTATSDANGVGVMNIMVGNTTAAVTGNTNFVSSASVAGKATGTANHLSGNGAGDKFGVYNLIANTAGGQHYGVYSEVLKSGATNFAGYFLGNLGIGTTAANMYTMPASRGTANQMMQTDGSGGISWKDPKTALNDFSWMTSGNSGTDPAVHFIGTNDETHLVFKVNNQPAGRIEWGVRANVFFGLDSGNMTTGQDNVGIGFGTLKNNDTGNGNVSIGLRALYTNDEGSGNVGIGSHALQGNESGDGNVAIGLSSLSANTTGSFNTTNGYYSLFKNKTGDNNVAIGTSALDSNVAGSNGTAIGVAAMQNCNNSAIPFINQNVAIGYQALWGVSPASATAGNANTAIGYQTLYNNGTGHLNAALGLETLYKNASGYHNTAIGAKALRENTEGFENSAVGVNALYSNSGGDYNTSLGFDASRLNSSGNSNTSFGHSSLHNNTSGSGNIAIGYQAGYYETASNKLYIENSNSIAPLVYGDFNVDLFRINGKTESLYQQLTANGDGQNTIYGQRARDSQNDGSGYGMTQTNRAIGARNVWGDLYTFGIAGYSDNDFNRTGGVLGGILGGSYWASLGYRSSALVDYGIYASAAGYGSGTGRMAAGNRSEHTIGGGFYGGIIGSWSKGNTMGSVSSGSLFASYNSGDEYTAGKQIELVETGNSKTAVYTVSSTEIVVYKKGKIQLNHGTARVDFEDNYVNLLGDIPIVTTTPMGECNGVYVSSVDKKGFTIKEINGGISNVSVAWIAVGDRVGARDHSISKSLTDPKFDENLNEVMFNENNKTATGKAIWSDGGDIRFGSLPAQLIEKVEKELPVSP